MHIEWIKQPQVFFLIPHTETEKVVKGGKKVFFYLHLQQFYHLFLFICDILAQTWWICTEMTQGMGAAGQYNFVKLEQGQHYGCCDNKTAS